MYSLNYTGNYRGRGYGSLIMLGREREREDVFVLGYMEQWGQYKWGSSSGWMLMYESGGLRDTIGVCGHVHPTSHGCLHLKPALNSITWSSTSRSEK